MRLPIRLRLTLAFGVGSLWTALYGAIIDVTGDATGLPTVFVLMAVSFLAAAIVMWPVRDDAVVAGGHRDRGPARGLEVEPVETV